MCYDVMTFTQQVDEICLITGVTEYTNGINFRRFHGGIFLPWGFHSAWFYQGIRDETVMFDQTRFLPVFGSEGVGI